MNTDQGSSHIFIRKYAKLGGMDGNLKGLTFAVKDNIGIADSPLSLGLVPPLISNMAKHARVVELLLAAGAQCIGSTNMDELCADYKGRNRYYGNMHHPLYPDLAALGSSTGSAISVANGSVDFALGSDFGGSIRAPAASCGLYGIKAPRNCVATEGAFLYGELDSLGLFTKSSSLLQKVLAVVANSGPMALQNTQASIVWIPHHHELEKMEQSCFKIFMEVCERLAKSAAVRELDPIFWPALQSRKPLAIQAMTKALAPYGDRQKDFPDAALAVIKRAKTLRDDEIEQAQQQKEALKSALNQKFESQELILTPTLTGLLPAVTELDKREATPLNMFLGVANLIDCVALAFPSQKFRTRQNIPFSLQVMGDAAQIGQIMTFSELF